MDDGNPEVENGTDENADMYPVAPERLPTWFGEGCRNPEILGEPRALAIHLSGCRQDVYSALSLYQVHVRGNIAAMLTLGTVITAIFSFIGRSDTINENISELVERMGTALLVLLFPIALLSYRIIRRYYEVYVSALLQSAQEHYWARVAGFWRVEKIIDGLRDKTEMTKEQYINQRTQKLKDTFVPYMVFIVDLGLMGLAAGIYLFVESPLPG